MTRPPHAGRRNEAGRPAPSAHIQDRAVKITRVRVYSVTMPPRTGGYSSGSGFLPHIDTSVVVLVDTDAGITGRGRDLPDRNALRARVFARGGGGYPDRRRGPHRRRPLPRREDQPGMGPQLQRFALPEGAPRHCALGHHGPGDRTARVRSSRRPLARAGTSLPIRAVRCPYLPRGHRRSDARVPR